MNRHIEILEWLRDRYPDEYEEALDAAIRVMRAADRIIEYQVAGAIHNPGQILRNALEGE